MSKDKCADLAPSCNKSPFAKRETDIPEFGGKCPECGHSRSQPTPAPEGE